MKFPPFGLAVKRILNNPAQLKRYSGTSRDGQRGTVWIATGPDAWDWHEDHPRHLSVVLPHDSDAAGFRWGFLRGHEPVLLIGEDAKDPELRNSIAAALMRDGVKRVLAGPVLLTLQVAA